MGEVMGKDNNLVDDIVAKAEIIALCLKNGDVEIRKTKDGISVAEVRKTVRAR